MSVHEGNSMYECFKPHLAHRLSLETYSRLPGINLVCDTCERAIAFEQARPTDTSWVDDSVWWGKYSWVGPVVLLSALAFTGIFLWRAW